MYKVVRFAIVMVVTVATTLFCGIGICVHGITSKIHWCVHKELQKQEWSGTHVLSLFNFYNLCLYSCFISVRHN